MQPKTTFTIILVNIITSAVVTAALLVIAWHWSGGLRPALTGNTVQTLPLPATESGLVSAEEIVPDVVAQVNDAVVSVVVTKDVPVYERYYEEFNPWGGLWGDFGGLSIPRVREKGTEEQEVGGGSGFIVSEDGLVVTNRHVVDDQSARYSILTNQGKSYEVQVLARDSQLDIAILKIKDPEAPSTLPFLPFGDSEQLRLGQTVIAIGNALGEFRNSVSVGVVSGLARSIVATDGRGRSEQLDQVIQTDAAINPGNSGGPLLDLNGRVIGVNVATTRGADNIGFALPAQVVERIVVSVQENGKIVRPYIGVRYIMINERLQELNDLSVDHGALVARGETREELAIIPGSPADKAGLLENDIILEVDGEKLSKTDLASVLRAKKVGDTVKLLVLTRGKEKEISLVLEEAP